MRLASATSFGLAVLAVATLAAVVAFLRWEVVREPVAGVPLPQRSRLLESDAGDAVGDEPCLLVVDARGDAADIVARWRDRLQRSGWESADTEIERTVFRRPGQRMLVNVVPQAGMEPLTRLRITLRPCRRVEE